MKRKPIKAVHSADLQNFLTSLGIWDDIQNGRMTCAVCGDVITIDNFQAVFPEEGKIRAICNKPDCMAALTKAGKVLRA